MTVARRELKLGFRNAWTYSFLILLTIFTSISLALHASLPTGVGYTEMIGTVINMTLYLLPLTTLLLGGFSITADQENGEWGLLSTYPITSYAFLLGKWLGLSIILVIMVMISYGVSGLLIGLFGHGINFQTFMFLLLFSIMLSINYLSVSLLIGALARNRWQALISGITVWFLTIVIWPMILISTLSHLPSYKFIQPTLQILTILNPAEFMRVFTMMRLEAGTSFGAEYDQFITWINGNSGLICFIGVFIAWIALAILIGGYRWKRSEVNG